MHIRGALVFLLAAMLVCTAGAAAATQEQRKIKILVVNSYHRGYVSSQDAHRGFCDAMLAFGYLDDKPQAEACAQRDEMETSSIIVNHQWMDAKRRSGKGALAAAAARFYKTAREFRPDLVFLADDEAGEYFGKYYLDTNVPVVFWGFNDSPVKYDLVDTAERPGHNVTGVYESGYYIESLQLLKTIAPGIKTIAALSDETVSGRTHTKALDHIARLGKLPLELKEIVSTSSYETWKTRALELQKRVDAFYVVHFTGLKDEQGNAVSNSDVAQWYRAHIRVPEATRGHYVKIGLLCAADDSMYKQAYEAVSMAHTILSKGLKPATYPTRTPARGALMVNRSRAAELGIVLVPEMGIEEYIDSAVP